MNFERIVHIRPLQFSSRGHSQLCNRWKKSKILLHALFSEHHAIKTAHLQQLYWLPISERIKCKTVCMCYNTITDSAPSYLSELLHLYSPSRSLCSSSDTRMLKLQCFNHKTHRFHTFAPTSGPISPKTSGTLLLSLPSKANSRHFSSQNISAKQHCSSAVSVCKMCVCVLEPLLMSTLCVSFC